MIRSTLLSVPYDGVRVKSIRRRRLTSSNSKVTSFQQNRTTTPEQRVTSFRDDSNKYEQPKHSDHPQKYARLWKNLLAVLYSILGILLLTALILPSILVYLMAPKSSQTGLVESSAYTNHCADVSSASLWELNGTTIITMTVNTSVCNFKDTPLYFVSISGTGSHYCLIGYGAIYLPTEESFQIYARYTCTGLSGTSLLSFAQANPWNVNWMGFYK